MFYLSFNRVLIVLIALVFSEFAQANESGRVVVSAESLSGGPKMRSWSFLVDEEGSKVQQSQLAKALGIYLEWDRPRNILKISSVDHYLAGLSHQESTPIKIVTKLSAELEGRSKHPVTLVSCGGKVVGSWSSPSLTFIANESLPLENCHYQIYPTGVLEVQNLTQSSGKLINEGKILSSTSLDLEILSGEFRNSGVIESQELLRVKGGNDAGRPQFFNSGRVLAPEIEVGNLLKRFYSFQNGEGAKGLIHTKKFFADIDYLTNSAEIQVPERISIVGFNFDNQKGIFHSGGDLNADFAYVNNSEGSLSGDLKTELKIRDNLKNEQGEIGSISLTTLTFHEGAQADSLGKIQGTELNLIANQNSPITLNTGDLNGQKSISIHSKSKIYLPQIQVHTPVLNLSVPDFSLDEQKDCAQTFIHCNPAHHFNLTSPYCTQGEVVLMQSCLKQPAPLDQGPSTTTLTETHGYLKKRLTELKNEVEQMAVYFKRDAGRVSQFKVFLRADLKSQKDVQFIAPLANIYIGDSEHGSEVGIEAKSLRAWTNFLFVLNGYVAAQDAEIHAPGGLRVGRLIEHPSDQVHVAGGSSYPLLCRNSGLWTTQNQTYVNGPLNCDGTMQIGGDLILQSEKKQWSFSPDIRVQGNLIFRGSGEFNLLRHLGETRHMGETTSSSRYSVPGSIRVEKSVIVEKPIGVNLYSTSAYADGVVDSNISSKWIESTGDKEIQFPGEKPQRKFLPSVSSRTGGVVQLKGQDNHGIMSAPKVFLIEQNGEFILATRNPYYLEEKNSIQDLMKTGFQLNNTYITQDLQTAMHQASEVRFHYSLRERFFFQHLESEKFYDQIKDHVVILKEGRGLTPLPQGPAVFSLSPQLLLQKVQDSCQENLMRGYLYEDKPISLELLADLHRNTTEYLNRLGIQWNAEGELPGSEQNFIAALENPHVVIQKPMIFYRQVLNEQGVEEFKPYFYLPQSLLAQARKIQTGNVFATILGRFSEGTTAEEMLNQLPERSGVRRALVEFFEENPETKKAVTQAASQVHLKETDPGSSNKDVVTLSFPIRSPHFAIIAESDVKIDTSLQGESAAFVSKKGDVILESQKTRKEHGGNQFEEEISQPREMTYQGHLEFRAGKDILLTAVNVTAGSVGLESKGNVIDSAMTLDSHKESKTQGSRETRNQRKSHVSRFNVKDDVTIRGTNIALQGTKVDAGNLQLEAQEKIAILGVNEERSSSKTTEKSTGALFWKGKKTETTSKSHSKFIPAQLKAKTTVGMIAREGTLQAPKIEAEETHLKGEKVRFLQGKSTSSSSTLKKSANAFWLKVDSQQESHETYTQPEIKGKVKIQAKTLELEQVKGQSLYYIDQLEYDPAQVEMISTLLEEMHHRKDESISAPGPALTVAVAVVMSAATAGTGGAAVAAVGIKTASLVGALTSAAISSLTAQIATQMTLGILAQQSPAEILKNIANKDTLKNVATAAITAGALYEIQGAQAAAETPELLRRIETSAAQAGVGMGTNLAFSTQNLGDALKGAGVQFVSQAASGYVAGQIGEQFANHSDALARVIHKISHGTSAAAFAGAGAAILGQNVEAAATGAAMGAMTAEIVADILAAPLQNDVSEAVKKKQADVGRALTQDEVKTIWDSKVNDIAQIAKLTGAVSGLFTGQAQGVNAASSSSGIAIQSNFLSAAIPLLWEAAAPALMELAAGTAFVGSAGVGGYALHEAVQPGVKDGDSVGQAKVRTEPIDLQEKLAMDEAKAAKGKKVIIPAEEMDDPRYKGTHDKQSWVHEHGDGTKTEVHNVKERATGNESDFKFKPRPNDRTHLPENKK